MPVDGQLQMEIGWLTVDMADNGMDAVAVALVYLVGQGGVGGDVAMAMNIAHEQMAWRQRRRHRDK